MPAFKLPSNNPHIKTVGSFQELISTPFEGKVNALCWQRDLPGNFSEIVAQLSLKGDITTLDAETLRTLPLSDAGKAAVEIMLEDYRLLQEHGLSPSLDCIVGYPRDEEHDIVPTDVFSFHADSATTQADTFLCTYHGSSSEGIRNDEGVRCVDVPEIRAKLLALYGGDDDESFVEFLNENCYDLHYEALAGAQPFAFGFGNLWRIAISYTGSPVLPCIHRAPTTIPGEPRLLLIS